MYAIMILLVCFYESIYFFRMNRLCELHFGTQILEYKELECKELHFGTRKKMI